MSRFPQELICGLLSEQVSEQEEKEFIYDWFFYTNITNTMPQ